MNDEQQCRVIGFFLRKGFNNEVIIERRKSNSNSINSYRLYYKNGYYYQLYGHDDYFKTSELSELRFKIKGTEKVNIFFSPYVNAKGQLPEYLLKKTTLELNSSEIRIYNGASYKPITFGAPYTSNGLRSFFDTNGAFLKEKLINNLVI